MKLIVGLGNPGKKYKFNRHNVGQRVIDYLLQSNSHNNSVVCKKLKTFMNDSGKEVSELVNYYKIDMDDLYVIHDDLDIVIGEYKIQKGTGPKGHNGVNSIEEVLGKDEFWRVRVGVENRDPDSRIPGETYVLQNFTEDEELKLSGVFEKIADELLK